MSDSVRDSSMNREGLSNHVIESINDYIRRIPTYKGEILRAESEIRRYLFDLINYDVVLKEEENAE